MHVCRAFLLLLFGGGVHSHRALNPFSESICKYVWVKLQQEKKGVTLVYIQGGFRDLPPKTVFQTGFSFSQVSRGKPPGFPVVWRDRRQREQRCPSREWKNRVFLCFGLFWFVLALHSIFFLHNSKYTIANREHSGALFERWPCWKKMATVGFLSALRVDLLSYALCFLIDMCLCIWMS